MTKELGFPEKIISTKREKMQQSTLELFFKVFSSIEHTLLGGNIRMIPGYETCTGPPSMCTVILF